MTTAAHAWRLAAFLLLASPVTTPGDCPRRAVAPAEDWTVDPGSATRRRSSAVVALEEYAFPAGGGGAAQAALRTDGVVVVHRGRITFERYANGYGPTSRHAAWSIAKSLTSALAGAAVARGALGIDDSICRYRSAPERHCAITARHLLESASGLDWTEVYEGAAPQGSSVLAMLYGEGRMDMAAFVLGHAARAPPGRRWSYSSGDSVLLAAVVRAALEPRLGADWPERALLGPLGMASAVLERDAAETPVGSSWLHATPRDLARLGLLYLDDGCWRGERLLPEGWVAATAAVSPEIRAASSAPAAGDVQGWGWWLNRPLPEFGRPSPWPGVPEDAFAARGHWGQILAVIPSLDMVIVRTGDDRGEGQLDPGAFLRLAIAAGRAD